MVCLDQRRGPAGSRRVTIVGMKNALLLLLLAVPVAAGVPETADPAEIPAYRLLRPDLAVAGQPSPQAPAGAHLNA